MFSKLLKSEARKALLNIFLESGRQKYYLRELAVRINYSPGSLQRELNGLVTDELLLAEKMGNLRFFSLNSKCPYLKELKKYIEAHPGSTEPKSPQSASKKAKPSKTPKTAPQSPRPSKNDQSAVIPTQSTVKPQGRPVLERRDPPPSAPAPVTNTPPATPAPASYIPPATPIPLAPMPAPYVPPAPQPLSAAPMPIPAPIPAPAPHYTFAPAESPIQSTVGYPDMISPFSKPVLAKPTLSKPDLSYGSPKQNSPFDYSTAPSETPSDYSDFSGDPAAPRPAQPYVTEPAQPLSPFPPTPTTQNPPPDDASGDIRLHIE